MSWRRLWKKRTETVWCREPDTGEGSGLCGKYGVQKVFTSFQDVCADPAVDIIYISTPHNTHIHFLRKALAAGKHVLCEKSITLNSEELEEAVQLAKEHGVVLAEAMTIYHMPIYKELKNAWMPENSENCV